MIRQRFVKCNKKVPLHLNKSTNVAHGCAPMHSRSMFDRFTLTLLRIRRMGDTYTYMGLKSPKTAYIGVLL